MDCFFTSHSLILNLPAHGEFGITDPGPRDGLLDPFLAKVLHPRCSEPHSGQGPRDVLAFFYWTECKLPANILRPSSTLSLMPQGLTKLPGYLSKYLLSCIVSSIQSHAQAKIADIYAWNTAAYVQSEKDSLLLSLTSHSHLSQATQSFWTHLYIRSALQTEVCFHSILSHLLSGM